MRPQDAMVPTSAYGQLILICNRGYWFTENFRTIELPEWADNSGSFCLFRVFWVYTKKLAQEILKIRKISISEGNFSVYTHFSYFEGIWQLQKYLERRFSAIDPRYSYDCQQKTSPIVCLSRRSPHHAKKDSALWVSSQALSYFCLCVAMLS